MTIEFDPDKERKNIAKHGMSLTLAAHLAWDRAMQSEDRRASYGETRWRALVPDLYDARLYFVAYTWRDGRRRIFSLRNAEPKERKAYVKAIR
jgi:uncharacterized DUF497 family protein